MIHIYREIDNLSCFGLQAVQLPLAAHPKALEVISASPTLCPIAAGGHGEGLYPQRGLSMAGWGRRKSPETAAGGEAQRLYSSQAVVSAKPPLSQDPYLPAV